MPGKTVKQITPSVSEPVQTPTSVPVVTQEVAQPTKQKGGKKKAETATVEVTPSIVVTATVESTPPIAVAANVEADTSPALAVTATKKGGGRKSKVVTEPTTMTSESDAPKKRVSKAVKASSPVNESSEQKGGKPKAVKKAVPKKVKASKQEAGSTDQVATTEPTDLEDSNDRRVRSFKVKLPDKEEFEGRFTGLTPYQAANKALSKYFRETENPKVEITFLICESTRKSKKSVYTYIGKRYQLDVPVKYTIQDGREIVKNFKNSLKKVKKVDLVDQSGGAVPVVALVAPVAQVSA